MEIAAFLIAMAALLLSVSALWYAHWAAARAASSRGTKRKRVAQQRQEPHFRLDHLSTHRYVLRNDGTRTAYDVWVETGELTVHEGTVKFDEFLPGQAEAFLLIQPMQDRVTELVVMWREHPNSVATPHATRLSLATGITPPTNGHDI